MLKKTAFLFFLALNPIAYNALAEMDYYCLMECRNNGGKTDKCTSQCTYGDHNASKKPAKKDPHAQFDDMRLANRTVLPRQRPASPALKKNYRCMAECQKNGMAYSYCQENCSHSNITEK